METNPLIYPDEYERPGKVYVPWTDPALVRITRLRLVSDRGFPQWDVSYCHGETTDGQKVRVVLPFDRLDKNRPVKAQIVEFAQQEGVYAAGLGTFTALSTYNAD
jgi:hypothetical protein